MTARMGLADASQMPAQKCAIAARGVAFRTRCVCLSRAWCAEMLQGRRAAGVQERPGYAPDVVETLNRAHVACCPIMTSRDMAEDPHYRAREVHVEWEDEQVGFLSIHRWPFYPGSGSRGETGAGRGLGYTVNLPVEFGTPRGENRGRRGVALGGTQQFR